jgi:hypothetical protein
VVQIPMPEEEEKEGVAELAEHNFITEYFL